MGIIKVMDGQCYLWQFRSVYSDPQLLCSMLLAPSSSLQAPCKRGNLPMLVVSLSDAQVRRVRLCIRVKKYIYRGRGGKETEKERVYIERRGRLIVFLQGESASKTCPAQHWRGHQG